MTEPDDRQQSTPSSPPSDEELRKLLKPNPTHDQILSILNLSFFHAEDELEIAKELDSYDDRNYVVQHTSSNPRETNLYLLKVHNGVESKDFIQCMTDSDFSKCTPDSIIHLQHAMMEHLHKKDFPVHRQETLHNWDHPCKAPPFKIENLPVVSPEHSPCDLVLRLFRWLPGQPMSSFPILPIESLADAGRVLGKLDIELDTMDASKYGAAKRFHQWDTKHTTGLRKFTQYIANTPRRQLVESIIDTFQAQIIESDVGATFRIGINHGDFNDANILVGEDFRVSGVIDFGDSVESWRVLDISVALAYSLVSVYGKAGRSLAAAAAMLRGYHSVYPLMDVERQHLHVLIACRLACSVALGAYSYQQNPENKYLLFHAEPAWKALEMLWGNGDLAKREKVARLLNSLLDQACMYQSHTSDKSKTTDDNHESIIGCTDLEYPDAYWLSEAGSSHFGQKLDASVHVAEPRVTFVTGNKKKLQEVVRILGPDLPCSIQNLHIDLPELQGEPDQICREKCALAAEKVGIDGGAVITEDTSLCFNAMNGLPGPYIKWYLEKCGHDGLNRMLVGWDDKSAYAQTIVGYCAGPGQAVFTFEGRTAGKIVPARGNLDFGWDPVFEPLEGGGTKTYAEMSGEEKDSISHRSRAILKLKAFLMERYAQNNP